MAGKVAGDGEDRTPELLKLVHDIVGVSIGGGVFKKDGTDLVRRIALLSHLFEEIRDFKETHLNLMPLDASTSSSSSSSSSKESWVTDLVVALQAAKRLLLVVANFHSNNAPLVSFLSLIFPTFSHLPNRALCNALPF